MSFPVFTYLVRVFKTSSEYWLCHGPPSAVLEPSQSSHGCARRLLHPSLYGNEPKMCVSLFLKSRSFLFNTAELVVGFSSRRVGFDPWASKERNAVQPVMSTRAVARLHGTLAHVMRGRLVLLCMASKTKLLVHIAHRTVPSSCQTCTYLQQACRQSHKADRTKSRLQ